MLVRSTENILETNASFGAEGSEEQARKALFRACVSSGKVEKGA